MNQPIDPVQAALAGMVTSLPAKPGADPVQADQPASPARVSVLDQRVAFMQQALPHLVNLIDVAKGPKFPTPKLEATLTKPMKRLGECEVSTDPTAPSTVRLAWKVDSAFQALHVQLHELVHAALPSSTGHGKEFRALCVALGYSNGGSASADPGPDLARRLHEIAAQLPAWPADGAPPKPPKKPKAAKGDDGSDELSDIANASRFLADHLGKVFHRPSPDVKHRCWYLWDGRRWKRDEANAIFSLAEQTAKNISGEYLEQAQHYSDQADDLAKNPEKADQAKAMRATANSWRSKAESMQKLTTMENFLSIASSRPAVNIDPAELDRHEYFLNCMNGTVDLRNGKVYDHDPKHLCTKLCPVDYVPGLTDARLDQVLKHVCRGDDDVVRYVQDVLGRSIIGNNILEQFWLWWGPGRSGKGTLMEAMKFCLGDYAMTAEFQSFVKTTGARVRDDLDRLHEARFVLASEVEKGEQMAAGVVKAMTGGDTIASRALFGTYREFKPRMTLHLQCNDRPRVDDRDSGMWGRMVVIPCGDTVPAEKRDPNIKLHLQNPKTGAKAVLSWLIAGAIRTHSLTRLVEPKAITSATAEYRQDQDPTRQFFADHLLFALPGANHGRTWCAVKDLMDGYKAYCLEEQLPSKYQLTHHGITERLEARGCYRKKIRADDRKPWSAWVGVTVPAEQHLFRAQSHRPSEEEHNAALSAVPVFSRSHVLESPTHAGAPAPAPTRTRAGDPIHSSNIEEHKNTGTDSLSSQPSSDAPGEGRAIDLTDV